MTIATEQRTHSPAYVAFTTFDNFIGHLKEAHVPPKIDKSVMSHLSGGTQSHLNSSLRFLGLVKHDQTPADELNQLVESYGTPSWKDVFGAVIKEAYADVVAEIDITKATAQQLDQCFATDGQSNVMVDKSVRFYLSALKSAGVETSKYFENRRPKATRSKTNGNGKYKAKPPTTEQKVVRRTESPQVPAPPEMIEYPIHFAGGRSGTIQVPRDISEADCEMIGLTQQLIVAYAKANG